MRIRNIGWYLLLASVAVAADSCSGTGTHPAGMQMDHGTGAPGGMMTQVVMRDNSFSPDRLTVRQGEALTLRFSNSGDALHEAVIGTADTQTQAEMAMTHGGHQSMNPANAIEVSPGKTGDLPFTFDRPGTFIIGCHQPGHYDAGMRVTVTVSPA